MGKADIYVFLIIVAIAAVIAAGYGATRLWRRLLIAAHERRRKELDRTTPWSEYLQIDQRGAYTIGIRRWHEDYKPFEGPIEMFHLPADTTQLDLELKFNEAKDRATFMNGRRNVC
jgi:hypothetical protein